MRDKTLERVGAWSGLGYILVFGLGWLILARWFPPISPADTAEQVAALYKEHHVVLMLASVIMMVSMLLLIPFSALMVLIMQRIERRTGMLTLMLGFSLATTLILSFYTPLSFSMAAFRPERSVEAVQLANDMGFLQFMGGIPLFLMNWVVMAFAILVIDDKQNPVLPRWFGYLNLWTAILYLPELLIYFFKTGPFAWDGIVGFWLPALLLILYFNVTPFVLVPALKRLDDAA